MHGGCLTQPLFIGPANAVAVTGAPWRWCRDAARALGVALVGHGRKQLIPAVEFMSALRRDERAPESEAPTDAAAALRERLGLRVVGGAR